VRPPSVKQLGVVTIGQSPRVDVVPEMREWLTCDIAEWGALDGLNSGQIAELAPSNGDVDVLTTRLRDGACVILAHDRVVPRVQAALDGLEAQGVTATLLLCTGEFPPLRHTRPVLLAEPLFVHGVAGLCAGLDSQIGVLCPLAQQEDMTRRKWALVGRSVYVASASPYAGSAPANVVEAAETLARRGASALVMDCMGYTKEMRDMVAGTTNLPVFLARSVVARLAAEAVG
jgi:protein AroM